MFVPDIHFIFGVKAHNKIFFQFGYHKRVCGAELFHHMYFVFAGIACGTDKGDTVRMLFHKRCQKTIGGGCAVVRAGSGAEAHIDDAGFAYRMCVVVDILDAVQNAGVSEQCGYEDQVGPGGYSLVLCAVAKRGAAAGGSARHVGAVRLRGVIGEDRPHLGFSSVFRTIIIPRRSCSKSIHLVPHALHAKNGAGGVVKGGVTELESHVDDPHHHAAAIEALR